MSARATAPAFRITTSANRVSLDANRLGKATFTVRNVSGRTLHCELRPVALRSAAGDWFRVQGVAVIELDDQAEVPVVIEIALPPTAAPGAYGLRLDAVGRENPDEFSTTGPEVTVLLGGAPPAGKGYVATLAGAAAGGLVGGLVGTLPGTLVLIGSLHDLRPGESIGQAIVRAFAVALLGVILLVIGAMLLTWAGTVAGAGLALRIRGYHRVALTLVALAVLVPIWGVLVIIGLNAVFSRTSVSLAWLLLVVWWLLTVGVPPLAARAIALIGQRTA